MKKIVILVVTLFIACCLLTACGAPQSPMEDTRWFLTSYTVDGQNRTPLPDTEVTVLFESDTNEVRGSASCNTYFGIYKLSGDKLELLEPFAVTEMWCGDEKGRQEQEYLDVLQAAESFEVDGDILRIKSGKGTLDFERR